MRKDNVLGPRGCRAFLGPSSLTMFQWFNRLLGGLLGSFSRPTYRVIRTDEHPIDENVKEGFLYLIETAGYTKWAYLRCPCPKKDLIRLALVGAQAPKWRVTLDRSGRPTVSPSIRQLDGCYSHFWIRSGHVVWC